MFEYLPDHIHVRIPNWIRYIVKLIHSNFSFIYRQLRISKRCFRATSHSQNSLFGAVLVPKEYEGRRKFILSSAPGKYLGSWVRFLNIVNKLSNDFDFDGPQLGWGEGAAVEPAAREGPHHAHRRLHQPLPGTSNVSEECKCYCEAETTGTWIWIGRFLSANYGPRGEVPRFPQFCLVSIS